VGSPSQVYERPTNLFVADFLGKMNFFAGRLRSQTEFACEDGRLLSVDASSARIDLAGPADSSVGRLGVRPERLRLVAAPAPSGLNAIEVEVSALTYLGALLEVHLRALDSGQNLIAQVPNAASAGIPRTGQRLLAVFDPADAVLLD
jgi:putative spermidine/putrescine transport system ATP-binding protein